MKTTIKGKTPNNWTDGDWTVRFVYESFFIAVNTVANSGEQAIRYAMNEIPVIEAEPLEIEAELMGTYRY
jgi:hypothetical protein